VIRAIIGADEFIARWVGEQLGIDDFGECVTFAIVAEQELIAGIVFNNYRDPSIEVTMASISPRWCTRSIMRTVFSYPFHQIGCKRITASVEDMNQPVRAFLCHLGFRQEGVMRQAFRTGRDAVIFGMLRDECRWLGQRNDVEGRSKRATCH
jgi:RimJ/RimL family protein N-acetyltransferase